MLNINNPMKQVADFFNNGDIHLGNRRLIDCLLDLQNTSYYKAYLDLIERYETHKDDSTFTKEALELLEKIKLTPINQTEASSSLILDVKELSKQYKVSAFKISPISFQLRKGEIIGLVGENGNGKTTLLRLLTGDLKPDTGTIDYQLNSHKIDPFLLRSKLVYIPQRVPRWYGTLMDNLQLTLTYHGITGQDNLLWVEMIIARLGLRPYKNLGWNRISSGYRTRFELAKSLLRKPQIMLLDEPLSNLDIISQQTILQDLKFLSESSAQPFGLILSSQQLYEVEKVSNMVIFLKRGEAKYQFKNNTDEVQQLVYEIETEASRDEINKVFGELNLLDINYNGGVYVIHFDPNTPNSAVYNCIGKHDLKLNYIRNITHSSRRFFIN
jgi:ABC-2 type transport system ATP-binding protein